MPVYTPRSDYSDMLDRWEKCRDLFEGAHAVKEKGTIYLPAIGAHKDKPEKYTAYKHRALFFNGMRRTVLGLGGAVFQKSPEVEVSNAMKSHLADITLTGVSLDLFALYSMREVLITGRYGILIDMGVVRPYWLGYIAENIISWSTERQEGEGILTKVVLRETVEIQDPDDEFITLEIEQYRVLKLVENVYMQSVYRKENSTWVLLEDVIIKRRGQTLDFIPFVFLNADGVSSDVRRPPLEDVADVNISHYHSMADLEWGRHFVALPTPWVSGLSGGQKGPLSIGSGVAWELEKDGRAGMLEFTGQGLGALEKADQQKRQMMAALGARLLEDQPNQPETARAVEIRHAGEHATLRTMTQVISQCLTMAMQWHAWWTGTDVLASDTKTWIKLNKDFMNVKASPEEIKILLLAWQAGGISFKTFYEGLQKGEWARAGFTSEEEQKQIQKEEPMISEVTENAG